MKAQELPTDLYQKWKDFGMRVGVSGNLERAAQLLATQYTEPHRYYHTLSHIRHCLNEFDGVRHLPANPNEVEMALWFHDLIYDTERRDNEERSAELAYNVAKKMGLGETFATRVGELILVTKHSNVPTGIDAKVLVDVDLAILGRPREEFRKYEREIRQEYAWVPDENFRTGRTTVLRQFSERQFIYSTEVFREKYEDTARANIAYSLSRLEKKATKKAHPSVPNKKEPPFFSSKNEPEAGIGIFSHWNDPAFQEKPLPEAGIGIFDHWFEHDEKDKEPDAGIGLFRHWIKED